MPPVLGPVVDNETRCVHYHLVLDVIAIKFKCCGRFYPCYKCHEECETHPVEKWPKAELATAQIILCGCCKLLLTFLEYLGHGDRCMSCGVNFNPGCSNHYDIYFDVEKKKEKISDEI